MLKIALGFKSQIKIDGVHSALQQLGVSAELIPVAASSDVSEQPFGGETIEGAQNRANHAAQMVPGADLALAIESGIFLRAGRYLDIAVVLARLKNGEFITVESDPVEFPKDAVEETICRGPDKWTCGKVMQELGIVERHYDPHASLAGKSRTEFINEAAVRLFTELRKRAVL
jgi:non-canonical (house-cleaning) NTP pyrophosphatase